jgi:thioredoxin reductase
MVNQYEVIIIGGSYSGLSSAMALGRALRKVLVLDTGKPCNRYTPHSHNFITQDGETPLKFSKSKITSIGISNCRFSRK